MFIRRDWRLWCTVGAQWQLKHQDVVRYRTRIIEDLNEKQPTYCHTRVQPCSQQCQLIWHTVTDCCCRFQFLSQCWLQYLNMKAPDVGAGLSIKLQTFWTASVSLILTWKRRFGEWNVSADASYCNSVDWAQQIRFYLRTDTDSSLRNFVFN
jgi:hypothetical protein